MTKTYETKLTVDGEFNPNREGPSEMKFTWNASANLGEPVNFGTVSFAKPPAPKITFNANGDPSRPVLTIEADGKIILHDDADPTEAAKQCLDAMQHLLHGMLQKQEDETRAALVAEIVAWLRTEDRRLTDGGAITDADHLADEIEAKWGKQ